MQLSITLQLINKTDRASENMGHIPRQKYNKSLTADLGDLQTGNGRLQALQQKTKEKNFNRALQGVPKRVYVDIQQNVRKVLF